MMGVRWLAASILALPVACSSEAEIPASAGSPTAAAQATQAAPASSAGSSDTSIATVTLTVEGMVCQGCAQAVTEALEGVGGVRSAEADVEGKAATIRFDASETDVDHLVAVIEGVARDPAPPFRITSRAVAP